MRLTGAEALQPVLKFLDTLIEEQGHILYMVLVYISIPLIAWILSGGLRRKPSRPVSTAPVAIIVIRPPMPPPPRPLPPPLPFERERDLPSDEDEDSFAA